MNAKRWAAHAALMATMVAGLTACGGGGDGAATETKAPEEQLTAGLTIKESTGGVFPAVGTYALKVVTPATSAGVNKLTFLASNETSAPLDYLEARVVYDSNTNTVDKAVIVRIQNGSTFTSAVGCGITPAFACSGIVINPNTSEIRASSVVLKELDFTSTNSAQIISDPGTTYAGTGSLKASGSLTP